MEMGPGPGPRTKPRGLPWHALHPPGGGRPGEEVYRIRGKLLGDVIWNSNDDMRNFNNHNNDKKDKHNVNISGG